MSCAEGTVTAPGHHAGQYTTAESSAVGCQSTPSTQICRLCSQHALRLFLELPHSAGNISRMLRQQEIGMIKPVDLRVFECRRCGFVQLTEDLGSTFYDDYVMTASHSPQMQAFQQAQAANFVERYGLRDRRVVEVGCGDGTYMECLARAGAIPAGIEPSRRFRELALSRGLQAFAGYVTAESPIPDGPYDGFTTRQVLEHVPDPHDFLQGIRASLTMHAAGLVEVPSLEQALEHQRFYDFFPDHLNYFSQRTLRVVLELNGFVVDTVERGMNGEYNVACVRVAAPAKQSDLQEHTNRIVAELQTFLANEQRAGRRVAVWGSGGKGVSALSISQAAGVAYVIDTDPHKHGRYTPVTHFPIVAAETLSSDPVDTVLVTALAYRQEILDQLLATLGFQGKVALLGPQIETL